MSPSASLCGSDQERDRTRRPPRAQLARLSLLLLLLAFLPSCGAMMEVQVTAPLPADDCGPKPAHPKAIVAAWANEHYLYYPPHPFTEEELTISEPSRVALKMPFWFPIGRPVGWQVIIGPENERLAARIECPYTRLIIKNDEVIFTESTSYPLQ